MVRPVYPSCSCLRFSSRLRSPPIPRPLSPDFAYSRSRALCRATFFFLSTVSRGQILINKGTHDASSCGPENTYMSVSLLRGWSNSRPIINIINIKIPKSWVCEGYHNCCVDNRAADIIIWYDTIYHSRNLVTRFGWLLLVRLLSSVTCSVISDSPQEIQRYS